MSDAKKRDAIVVKTVSNGTIVSECLGELGEAYSFIERSSSVCLDFLNHLSRNVVLINEKSADGSLSWVLIFSRRRRLSLRSPHRILKRCVWDVYILTSKFDEPVHLSDLLANNPDSLSDVISDWDLVEYDWSASFAGELDRSSDEQS